MTDRKLPKVLVVEDSEHIRTVIAHFLKQEAYDVVPVASGREAIAALSRGEIDAVLLDIMLPDMDGFKVCQATRALAEGKTMPIIMLTARATRMDVFAAARAGATDYIVKPFAKAIVLEKLRKAMGETGESRDSL